MRTVILYSRPGCHLCDDARAVLRRVGRRTSFAFEEIDVSGVDALELEYGVRIPVVLVDGQERFELTVDEGELASLLGG